MDEKPVVFLHDSEFVHPVDPEFIDLAAASKIVLYLQRHPGKTIREIAKSLRMIENTVRSTLFKLSVSGEVRKLPKVDGDRRARWAVGEDDTYLKSDKPGFQFKRIRITEWEPETRRDPLVEALFGNAKQQEGKHE